MRKKGLEGFYYGLLVAGFLYFLEWWQEEYVGLTSTLVLLFLPLLSAWWFSSKWIEKLYEEYYEIRDK